MRRLFGPKKRNADVPAEVDIDHPYFSTLSDLSSYFSAPRRRASGIQEYHPRPFSTSGGKLLVRVELLLSYELLFKMNE